jgi:hypothetical protein
MINNFSFDLLEKKDLNKTLELRNQDQTRKASFNKNLITRDEHYSYFDNLTKTDFCHYYALRYKQKFIDTDIKSEIKFGTILKFFLLEKLFSIKIVNELTCQVLKEYEWIKDWHIRWANTLTNYDESTNCFNLKFLKKDWEKISRNKFSELF